MTAALRRSPRAALDAWLLALGAAAVVLSLVPVQPVSAVVVLAALCVIPGAACLTRLGADDPLTALALAVGLSLAIDTAVATSLAWSGLWHPELAAAAVLAGAAVLLVRDLRRAVAESTGTAA